MARAGAHGARLGRSLVRRDHTPLRRRKPGSAALGLAGGAVPSWLAEGARAVEAHAAEPAGASAAGRAASPREPPGCPESREQAKDRGTRIVAEARAGAWCVAGGRSGRCHRDMDRGRLPGFWTCAGRRAATCSRRHSRSGAVPAPNRHAAGAAGERSSSSVADNGPRWSAGGACVRTARAEESPGCQGGSPPGCARRGRSGEALFAQAFGDHACVLRRHRALDPPMPHLPEIDELRLLEVSGA